MIELKNIHKQFDEKVILDDFSYQFENGQSYALTGMSGSGKTTLLNMIGKIEKPDTGDVLIDQKQLRKIPEQVYFQNYAGYLFQNYGLIDNETIEQNLTLAFVGKHIKKAEQKSQMLAALKQVNLTLDLSRKVYSLSGGEAQRVAIAKIILKKPMIILADEPTAALDEKNGQEVVDLMKQLVTDDTILIVATHNPMVWKQLNQRVKLD